MQLLMKQSLLLGKAGIGVPCGYTVLDKALAVCKSCKSTIAQTWARHAVCAHQCGIKHLMRIRWVEEVLPAVKDVQKAHVWRRLDAHG
jgi:hypothetical protein